MEKKATTLTAALKSTQTAMLVMTNPTINLTISRILAFEVTYAPPSQYTPAPAGKQADGLLRCLRAAEGRLQQCKARPYCGGLSSRCCVITKRSTPTSSRSNTISITATAHRLGASSSHGLTLEMMKSITNRLPSSGSCASR